MRRSLWRKVSYSSRSDLKLNDYFVMRIYIYMCVCACVCVPMYMILNNQYYIWWLCKKWKKLNPKGCGNITLIRKERTIIFIWRAYKLLLRIV